MEVLMNKKLCKTISEKSINQRKKLVIKKYWGHYNLLIIKKYSSHNSHNILYSKFTWKKNNETRLTTTHLKVKYNSSVSVQNETKIEL